MRPFATKLSPTITNMIRADHTAVLASFHKYELDTSAKTKRALVNSICVSLEIHAQLEEEIFYPAMRAVAGQGSVLGKSVPEHDAMRSHIAQLRAMEPNENGYDQTFMKLMREVIHHVADEETVLLPEAERLLQHRLSDLGAEMTRRRMELAAPRAGEIAYNVARSRPVGSTLLAASALLAGGYLLRRSAAHRHL